MGNNRLIKMVQADAIPNRGGVFIDAYNQSTNEEIAGTITTRVDAANMIYVTEVCSTKARKYTHTKVSIGTPRKSSSVENWGGIARCVKTDESLAIMEEKVRIPQATKEGFIECEVGGVFDGSYPNSTTRRGRVQGGGAYLRHSPATAMG